MPRGHGQGRRFGRKQRPSRTQVDPAALALIERYGAQVMGTARRYSETAEDAEDAYQRGLEILLTKAPTATEEELLPWLKTVVKHEAFAIRRQRERSVPVGEELLEQATEPAAGTHELTERYERLRLGAEALGRLKPQEVRCLLLRAEGYSYKQICDETGWTYTKVNRCLAEGRQSFLHKLARIEAGAECERLAPLLSALADGEATAEQMSALRPHLRTCLACRATIREFREAPARVAALVPPAAIVSASEPPGAVGRLFEWIGGPVQERAASAAQRAHAAVELATAQKAAAVAASTAALAGGGVATLRTLEGGPERGRLRAAEVQGQKRDAVPARAGLERSFGPLGGEDLGLAPGSRPGAGARARTPGARRGRARVSALKRVAPPSSAPYAVAGGPAGGFISGTKYFAATGLGGSPGAGDEGGAARGRASGGAPAPGGASEFEP